MSTPDYRTKTTLPIRDMYRDGAIAFLVDVYGWTGRDAAIVPGGSEPFRKAVERIGLDPDRYQAVLWDINVGPDAPLVPEPIKGARRR